MNTNQRQVAGATQEFLVLFPHQVPTGPSGATDIDAWAVARVALPGSHGRHRMGELSRRMAPWAQACVSAPPSSLVMSTLEGSGPWMAELEAAAAACGSAVETMEHDQAAPAHRCFGPYVLPSGLRIVAAGHGLHPAPDIVVIEQGLAAGDDWQRAAALCMYALDVFVAMEGPARVLDVGTRCGAVALVAARRGATRVVAVDSDPYARFVARRNIQANGADIELGAAIPDERFDVVVAGLGLHADAPEVVRAVRPGGLLILATPEDGVDLGTSARPGLRLVSHLRDEAFGVEVLRRV